MQEKEGQKRNRVESGDSGFDSLDSKRVRLDSYIMTHNSSGLDHPVKDESNSEREDFLHILEEEHEDAEPQIQGLESVIRSLEDEINPPAPVDLMLLDEPDQIELGYLLEPSDDELGLPPAESIVEGAGSEIDPSPITSPTVDLTGVRASKNDDSFEHRIAGGENLAGNVLTIDGLFEYGGRIEASDLPELEWRPESMPAL